MLPPKFCNNQNWTKYDSKIPTVVQVMKKTPTFSNQENQMCFLTSPLGCPKPNQYIPFRSHNYDAVANHLNSKWKIQTTKNVSYVTFLVVYPSRNTLDQKSNLLIWVCRSYEVCSLPVEKNHLSLSWFLKCSCHASHQPTQIVSIVS